MSASDEIRAAARAAGLDKLTDAQLAEFAASRTAARGYAAKLPKDLSWTEEPALTLSLTPRREATS